MAWCLVKSALSAPKRDLVLPGGEVEGFGGGPIYPNHPQRSAEVAGAGSSASHLQPATIFFVGLISVHEDVTVAIPRACFAHRDSLVPAMLSADRVGLNGEGQILMYARIFPVDARRIGIVAFEGLNAMDRAHHPLPRFDLLQIDQRRGPAFTAKIFFQTPPPEMMGASNNAGTHAFSRPNSVNEIADRSLHAHQIAGDDAKALGVVVMHPDRILVRDFIEPLRIARPGMDQRGQAKGGQKKHLAFGSVDVVAMDMTLDVTGNGMLRPVPVFQSLRIKFEFARRCGETSDGVAIDLNSDRGSVLLYYVRKRIDRAALQLFWLESFPVQFVNIVFNQECAVLPPVIEWREPFAGSRLRQTGNTVLKNPAVILIDSDFLARTV